MQKAGLSQLAVGGHPRGCPGAGGGVPWFFALCLAALVALPPLVSAADWPMFRGNPALTGVAPGSLGTNLALLWTYKTDKPVRSSPAVANGRVFVGSDDEHVHAIDLATGRGVWKVKTGGPIESSPLVFEGKVYVGSDDGLLRALDAATGRELWQFKCDDKIPGSPNVTPAPGGQGHWLVFGSFDSRLYCLDAATGKSNWVFETGTGIKGTPAVLDGVTAVGGCDAMLHLVSLKDGAKVKEVEVGAPMLGSVALARGRAFVGHYENVFLCVDLDKGTNLWTYQDRGFPYVSSPALLDDRVVVGGRDKRLHCLRRDTGAVIWTFATRGRVDSSPAVCDGKVVVGSEDGRLYLVALADGRELWSYEIGGGMTSSPAVVGGRILIGNEDGSVYCFGPRPG
ncbi:MAG: Serine/threonine-protein kinase AfsK [Verrucomicrobiota bacterium]